MKRIFLFLATNIAVLVVVSIVLRLLGIDQAMAAQGGMGRCWRSRPWWASPARSSRC